MHTSQFVLIVPRFTVCNPVQLTDHDYTYQFIFPRLQSSEAFRLDFAVKGEDDAILSLSQEANEDNYYDISECYHSD